jgi:signal transduction histidine kinase
MPPTDRLARLRHDLANPLSAVLAESELTLLQADSLPPEVVTSLEAIHAAAIRMRTVLRESSSD